MYDLRRDSADSVLDATLLLDQALRKATELGELLEAAQAAISEQGDRHSRRRQQCVDVLTGYLRLPYNPQASQTHLIGTTVQRTTGVDEDQAIVTDTSAYRPNARTVLAATGSSDRRSRRRFVPLRVGSGQPARPRRLRVVRALPRMGHRRRGRRCPSHARH